MCGGPPGRPEARRRAQTGFASVPRRLELIGPEAMAHADGQGGVGSLPIAPPIRRTPMAPTEWPATILSRFFRRMGARGGARATAGGVTRRSDRETITRTAVLRRTIFIMLGLAQTAAFAYFMATQVLPYHGQRPLEIAILSLFTILFTWVSLGFWTALSGFVLLCLGGDRHAITPIGVADGRPSRPTRAPRSSCRSATSTSRACSRACARPTSRCVATGVLERFDFFVLSDSSEPDTLRGRERRRGSTCAAPSTGSGASSIAGAGTASSARAATSPTSAGAGAASTGTWSCSTPTAS